MAWSIQKMYVLVRLQPSHLLLLALRSVAIAAFRDPKSTVR
jgi:hypothetical protein